MLITEFDLKFANFIQDTGEVDIKTCTELFDKSESTLKRSVYRLNDYLPASLHFVISNHIIESNMTYSDYTQLCKSIELIDYAPSVEERLNLAISIGFLQGIVNMTELYEELNLSLSTKKKDRKKLGFLLEKNGVDIINRHRLGISFEGNEVFLRMYVAKELMDVIELNRDDNFVARLANTPIQKMLYSKFEEYLADYHYDAIHELDHLFGRDAKSVDYASKKFIYIHAAISLMRLEKGYAITEKPKNMPKVPRHNILPSKNDNKFFDYLIASLNYKKPLNFPLNKKLKNITNQFIRELQIDLGFRFYTYQELYDELYAYFYKSQIKNKLGYYFYDDKLENVEKVFPELYDLVYKKSKTLTERYSIALSESQISTVALIIERFMIKNRLIKQDRRKIIIITNSSVEIVNFFLEVLAQHINFEMVSYLTINELYKLDNLEFDTIITFSNRISVLLSELGWKSIKLNFYVSTDDIKKLLDNGFRSSRNRKILAKEVIEELEMKDTKEEKIEYLKKNFPQYML